MTEEEQKRLTEFVAVGVQNFLNGPMAGAEIHVDGDRIENGALHLKLMILPRTPVDKISQMLEQKRQGHKVVEPEEFEARYLPDSVMYPRGMPWDFPLHVMQEYVSSSLLNGFINYGTVLSAWLINRYRSLDRPAPEWAADEDRGPKRALVDKFLANERAHPNIGILDDDVLILTRCKHADPKEVEYAFFWFDCDVSDCCIGRFKTDDPEADVVARFKAYVFEKNKAMGDSYGLNQGEEAEPPTELPVSRMNGWISF